MNLDNVRLLKQLELFVLKVKENQIKVRALDPKKDLHFILSTWLKSYRQSDFAKGIPNDIFFSHHEALISQILLHPKNSVTILCDPEDEDQIIGYVVYNTEKPIIFYTYVKFPFRNLGLGRHLFEGVKAHFKNKPQIICTHKVKRFNQTAKKFNLTYNPYIIGS